MCAGSRTARLRCAFDGSEEPKEKAEKGVTETCRREDEEERRKASGRERSGALQCSPTPANSCVCSVYLWGRPDDIPSRIKEQASPQYTILKDKNLLVRILRSEEFRRGWSQSWRGMWLLMVFTCTGRRALACGGAAGSPGCQAELWWTFPQEGVFCLGEREDDHLAYLGACGASAALTVTPPTPCQSVPEQDTGGWMPSISGVAEIALLTWLSYQMCLPCFQS